MEVQEKVKFTEGELKTIAELQQRYFALTQTLGELHLNKLTIENSIVDTTEKISDLRTEEQTLVKDLSDKYGSGTLDLSTGEFIPTTN